MQCTFLEVFTDFLKKYKLVKIKNYVTISSLYYFYSIFLRSTFHPDKWKARSHCSVFSHIDAVWVVILLFFLFDLIPLFYFSLCCQSHI